MLFFVLIVINNGCVIISLIFFCYLCSMDKLHLGIII